MKTVNKIAIRGEEYNIAFTHIEGYFQVEKFLEEKNPTRVELFRDDDGKLYTVDKGDLEFYFLRTKSGEKIEPILDAQRPNMFLQENQFEKI